MANLKNTLLTGTGSLKIPSGRTGERSNTSRVVTQFTATGTTTWTCPGNVTSIEILLVGGGGGGGGYVGGGGGAGGMVEKIIPVTPGVGYSVTVGAGGVGGNTSGDRIGRTGGNTSFIGGTYNLIAYGGGGGGAYPNFAGLDGGSGGGAGGASASERTLGGAALQPTSPTGGFGNRGGAITFGGRSAYDTEGRGGGGAGQPGMDGDTRNQSSGGNGRISRITGTEYWYAGGGGAGGYYTADQGDNLAGNGGRGGGGGGGSYVNGVAGSGGTGGTANGGVGSTSGEGPGGNGGANTGGGGGGAGHSGQGGQGGSGVVVIAYYINSDIGNIRYNTEVEGVEIFEHTGWKVVDSKLNWGSSNALTFSNDLTNAIWTKDNVTLTSGQSAPDGSNTAFLMTENSAAGDHRLYQLPLLGAGGPGIYVLSVYVKYVSRRYFILRHDSAGVNSTVYFDLLTGSITQEAAAAGGPNGGALGEIIPVNNSWFFLKATLYYDANTTSSVVYGMSNVATGGSNPTYTGDGASAVLIWRPEFSTATDINANGYRTHIYRNLGSGQAFTPTFTGDVEVLVVAGGGSGASTYGGIGNGPRGGGGAGGVIYSANYQVQAGRRYPIVVGAGGAKVNGANVNGNQGGNSSFSNIVALGGGFGGRYSTVGTPEGGSGGSGGGSAYAIGRSGFQPGAGNYGSGVPSTGSGGAGGGGGAGAPGYQSADSDTGGSGGVGAAYSISGALTYYGGGGGAGGYPQGRNCYGLGGRGGGGRGGQGFDQSSNIAGPQGGQVATGGGGGAGGSGAEGGAGGSGIVIVRYKAPTKCNIFYQSGVWTCPPGISKIRLLVVAGGGGGGMDMGGGGGAGGLIYREDYAVESGQTYNVVVGAGGAGARARNITSERGQNGSNSSFGRAGALLTATGGGGGASLHDNSTLPAGTGGSGGGASGGGILPSGGSGGAGGYGGGIRGTGILGQGCDGGTSIGQWYPGGGGGAGAPGTSNPGAGGAGRAFPIAGTMLYYAGGGGGSGYSAIGGNGGRGGGGAGAVLEPVYGGGWSLNWGQYGHGGRTGWQIGYTGSNAGANTGGGGGGGSHYNNANEGGDGGSGVVVIAWD